jgi:hypothetical protein
MDKIEEARAFHETHKMKIGRDYRLEFLKLSKEDIYDFLENIYGDYIHGWRQNLGESQNTEKRLTSKINELKEAMQEFVDRVDKGEVRSKYTYAKFKQLLNK